MTDQQKTILIRKDIIEASKDLKLRYPFLKHQDLIGGLIFLFSVGSIILASILYLKVGISAWILIPWNAFWMSILHEMEHDLIHYMYFKKNAFIANFMLGVGWIARPLTVNPWFRRELHFHHHKYSGTIHDVEERGVTNGDQWNFKRLLSTPDLLLGGILRTVKIKKDIIHSVKTGLISKEQALKFKKISTYGLLPFSLLMYLIWYVFLVHYAIIALQNVIGFEYTSPSWLTSQFHWINPLVMILIAPNILRQFCLHFITSNLHYYGDVTSGNVMQQTQIFNVWWTFPMQLFCFFFGYTHAIHHFHVNETFYIRHFTRKKAWQVMKENGVRFNDLGTFRRANRYQEKENNSEAVLSTN
jgi:fatty acid desaturase